MAFIRLKRDENEDKNHVSTVCMSTVSYSMGSIVEALAILYVYS
jgi:hypothetical protein